MTRSRALSHGLSVLASSIETLPDVGIADELPPLVKPGSYDLAFIDYKTALMFAGRAAKLIMRFRIITFGEHFETELYRYYNVARIIGRPARNGKFKCSAKGDFLREFATLFTGRITRLDRIPMSAFENVIIEGKVSTVTHSRGKAIPELLQYSVISELRKVK